ncbi:hypothetical protein Aph01nite_13320 [Acrocarpospora phusangensis]|uniref:Antirepressor protein ant N-terminal domain-containing protein n=1 Tax=Acrocarpospora phusangensis TaxID=1070424 RepID=A0A919QAY0_9ACTN|nr:phage antirepressor N-terminal domain-containing protein [Acrocarpospora phusangensis]GIH23022.1 hypothetical protein Aph01nite_13320 [Acrocarpospora phusangensis]
MAAVPALFEFDGERFPVVPMPNGDLGLPLRRLTVPVGLDPDGQRNLIKRSAWSKGRTDNMYVQLPGDTQVREHFVISHRIVPMWIANIETGRMANQSTRERIERWQVEFADALYDYVFNGGAINPRATTDQLADIIGRAEAQARVLASLKGVVNSDWLDAKGRHVAALALGMEPDIDPASRPLTVGEYLEGRGITGAQLRSLSPGFGKRVKAAYRARYGAEPGKVDRFVDGALRAVAAYTEAHRPLFDQTWRQLLGAG